MNWLLDLYQTNPTAQAIAIICLVCMIGMAVGGIRIRGVGLGHASVLFAGILVGAVTRPIHHATLEFVKELGLILFVFCIGLQLGPGFFASFRRDGVRLNALAAAVVTLGALGTVAAGRLLSLAPSALPGVFSGASTNTPSLGAAQQAMLSLDSVTAEDAAMPALAYAVTYPVAIVGILGTILLLKQCFRNTPQVRDGAGPATPPPAIERRTLLIDNPGLDGVRIDGIPGIASFGALISRWKPAGEPEARIATGETVVRRGDLVLAVGTRSALDQAQKVLGSASTEDLLRAPGSLKYRRVVVTHRDALGKTVHDLSLGQRFGVTVTRVTRSDLEMTAVPDLRLQFGDVVQVVGLEEGIQGAAGLLGNSLKALNETHFVPVFAGMVAGILLGLVPLTIPGVPGSIQLGLAGGPLIVAILLGRIGKIGPLVWHMPLGANIAFRDLGISLFFASVGLLAGPRFFATVMTPDGVKWIGAGLCVTVIPLVIVGVLALGVMKLPFATVSGLLAGSMTDPPALAFANNVSGSDAPTVSYATVYPLTTVMRIIAAQFLTVLLLT